MTREQIITLMQQVGVAVSQWSDVCAYAGSHTWEFARVIAEAEREACVDACTSADVSSDMSPRVIVSCYATAILNRSRATGSHAASESVAS